jgi:hypothetical protein
MGLHGLLQGQLYLYGIVTTQLVLNFSAALANSACTNGGGGDWSETGTRLPMTNSPVSNMLEFKAKFYRQLSLINGNCVIWKIIFFNPLEHSGYYTYTTALTLSVFYP